MPNTYTQIHIHVVFTVQNRNCIILKDWKDELYRYITGIIQNNDHKVLAINGMPDHVHIMIGMRPTQSLSDLMQDIKGDSSKWTNQKGHVTGRFSWQEGYGAFSYGRSQVKGFNYIINILPN
ncbi:MAG: IS200/IS605 family transposase [Bacteroidales bacterium]|nr:IS200/IS605 family transposase [Bacteroidales bacterium]